MDPDSNLNRISIGILGAIVMIASLMGLLDLLGVFSISSLVYVSFAIWTIAPYAIGIAGLIFGGLLIAAALEGRGKSK